MNIIVDTSVWSLVLRRKQIDESLIHVIAFKSCINSGVNVHLSGIVLQELLDGLKSEKDFARLLTYLAPFPFLITSRETHIQAAQLRNKCRKKGVQASPADFLIASSCIENGFPLLTSDDDFKHIAQYSDLVLFNVDQL